MNVELPEATQLVYLEALLVYPQDGLLAAFRRVLLDWDRPSQMPTISFISTRVPQNDFILKSEQAWEMARNIARHYWHPDIGFLTGCPQIDAAMSYAVRNCGGGWRRIERPIDAEDATFCRKDFITAYKRFCETGGEQLALSPDEAKDFIQGLQIAAGTHVPKLLIGSEAIKQPQEKREPLRRVSEEWTAEEYERRMEILKRQAEQLKSKAGEGN